MPAKCYVLEIRSAAMSRAAAAWLMLGLAALVGAGLFSVLLILARTPAIQEVIPLVDFFRVALVVHVNLSVLIWLLSMAGVFWSLASGFDWVRWDRMSYLLAAAGTAIVVISPFVGAADPLMNNYVPLLRHPVFYTGMILFAAGITSHLLRSLLSIRGPAALLDGSSALHLGSALGGLITLVAIASLIAFGVALLTPALGNRFAAVAGPVARLGERLPRTRSGLSGGLVVGVAQRPVLKRHVERAGRWVLISAVAWATGAVAMGLLAWAIDRPGQEIMFRVVPVIGGIVPGVILATELVRLMPPDRSEPILLG